MRRHGKGPVLGILVLLLLLGPAPPAGAGSFSHVIAFGDSLSDTGNFFGFFGFPLPPYFGGRASNGPVWVEHVAASLGVPLINAAFIGSISSDVLAQTVAFPGPIPPSALVSIWGGANDLLFAPGAIPDGLLVALAVGNLTAAILQVDALGADTILVPNLPDLGRTANPFAFGIPGDLDRARLTARSILFNDALAAALGPLDAMPGIEIIPIDIFSIFDAVLTDPASFGFANATDPCLVTPTGIIPPYGPQCGSPDGFVFWDGIHPTGAAHRLLGRIVTQRVPEPASLVLLGLGLVAAGMLGRRRHR